ncbi:MAG: ACT domain-containing protein [Fimbriimonadaceae bacterium]|nr:ACT domain-containing protein [Fimbriimonadaceae bacterium]
MTIRLHPWRLSVCRIPPRIGHEAVGGAFSATVSAPNETSVVCEEGREPLGARVEPGWRAFEIQGPIDFDQVGVLASVLNPLADALVPVFAISTYDTDFVMVKETDLRKANRALLLAGHEVSPVTAEESRYFDSSPRSRP